MTKLLGVILIWQAMAATIGIVAGEDHSATKGPARAFVICELAGLIIVLIIGAICLGGYFIFKG